MASNGAGGPPKDLERNSDQTKSESTKEAPPPVKEKEGKEDRSNFKYSEGLTTEEANVLRAEWGPNELEEKSTPKWLVFLKLLYQPMPIMIWIAIIIEAALQQWPDMGILLGIQFINATLGWYESVKAADAVAALKASLKPSATVKRDGQWQNCDAVELVPGDLVLLASGSNVPADCVLNGGRLEIDQSALTGESLPVTMYKGDGAKMGSTVTRGETEATVEATGKHTFFGKTATMLQGVQGIGHLQKILMTIMAALIAISIVLCLITLFYLIFKGGENVKEALTFVVVLLVASIPIAIEIVCTATLALGSRQLSSHGAIVTRLASIEEMAGMNMLCSDKTGTLTLNKMVIQDDCPIYTPGETQESILLAAALAAKWKEPPRDALDTLVLTSADLDKLQGHEQIDFMPFDPTIKRTEGTIKGPDGKTFKTTKGAPNIIVKLVEVDAEEVAKRVNWKVNDLARRGIRALAVAKTNDEGKWQMLGILTFLDPPRPDTKETIERAMEYGCDVKMITGDHTIIAKETARALGLGTNIQDAQGLPTMGADGKIPKDLGKNYGAMILAADGFAQVFPEHKYLIVEALRQEGFACGMTGDGVNDAPALKRADVGIAVQGATDAARAAADMVLTQPGLSVIVEAIRISRCIFARMKNFINYRIACTLQLLIFFFIAVLSLHPIEYFRKNHQYYPQEEYPELYRTCDPGLTEEECFEKQWPDFFKMPVMMLMLITVLNDGTLISIAYDFVIPSRQPEKWNLKVLWFIAAVLAAVALGSSLLLLWAALDSWNPNGIFHALGLPPMKYSHIITMMYLKVSVSDFLTLFSARTHHGFFWSQPPGKFLAIAALISLGISTALACVWPESYPDNIPTQGMSVGTSYTLMPLWVWIYCILSWFVQDAAKLVSYWFLRKFDIFQINTDKMVNMRGANKFNDNPLARMSAGVVEGKVLEMKVDRAADAINRLSQNTAEPGLRRASQDLALVRGSVKLARASLGGEGGEAALGVAGTSASAEMAKLQAQVAQIESALAAAPAEQRLEIQAQLDGVKRAAAKLSAVEKLARDQ